MYEICNCKNVVKSIFWGRGKWERVEDQIFEWTPGQLEPQVEVDDDDDGGGGGGDDDGGDYGDDDGGGGGDGHDDGDGGEMWCNVNLSTKSSSQS